jgi:hypothetical protein
LADVQKTSRQLPSRLVLNGQAGIGKTSFAAQATAPLFLLSPGETGLLTLMDAGLVPPTPNLEIDTWPALVGIIDELTATEHAYKTLVVDTLDGMEKLANAHVCQTDYTGDWSERGFMGYQRGYKSVAAGPWRELLARLDKLRETKRMGVVLLAHSGVANFSNPAGGDYSRYVPDMFKDAWTLTFSWADIVLFGTRDVKVAKERGDAKTKGKDLGTRTIYTEWNAAWDAKNRHNLAAEIDMGNSGKEAWDNVIAAVRAGRAAADNGKVGEA